jgi:hypothetical protein
MRDMAESGRAPGAKIGPGAGYRWVFTEESLEEYLRDEIRRQLGGVANVEAIEGADIETWKLRSENWQKTLQIAIRERDYARADVERLKEACASSPVAMARFKELEGKTTFKDINPGSQLNK